MTAKFIHIQSLQSTTHVSTNLNPDYLHVYLPHTQFDPQLPHKIHHFMQQPKTRFTLFRRGGKIVMMGGKSVADVHQATQQMVDALKLIGMDRVQFSSPLINNICSSGYVGFKIHLQQFANHPHYENDSIYEQEQYPGLRYRGLSSSNPSITATVFHSGKCIVTGARQEQEIITAFDTLLNITTLFKIKGSETDLDDIHIYTNIQSVEDPFIRFERTGSLYLQRLHTIQ